MTPMFWLLVPPSNQIQPQIDPRLASSAETFLKTTSTILGKSKCIRCYMHKCLCVCSVVAKIAAKYALNLHPQLEIQVFMHYKEIGRPSNTGKIVRLLHPTHTIEYTYGTPDSLDMIARLIANNGFILFPDKESIPLSLSTFSPDIILNESNIPIESIIPVQSKVDSIKASNNSKKNILCIIDATWREAKTMNKWIPSSIPRVHLPTSTTLQGSVQGSEDSLYLTRKRAILASNTSTFSTIEAVSKSFDILHPYHNGKHSQLGNEVLRHCVDAVFKQRGVATPYGSDIQPVFSDDPDDDSHSNLSGGAYVKPQVDRPSSCPSCSSSTRFKNMGVHAGGIHRWMCRECKHVF